MSDEKMLAPARGRVPRKNSMPNELHKCGFKLWSLAGAKSGYVTKFQIFGDNMLQHEEVESTIGALDELCLSWLKKCQMEYIFTLTTTCISITKLQA